MELIPSQAPFTPEQSAQLTPLLTQLSPEQNLWLSGFLAGRASLAPAAAQSTAPAKALAVTVLYGTESGNAEALAGDAQKRLKKAGLKATVKDMADITPADLKEVEYLLIIVSTWGEGDPPERAAEFYEALMGEDAPRLEQTRFTVCGLGDSSYEHFCQMGKAFDERLVALGAGRLGERVDCDVDFEEPFEQWMEAAIGAFKEVSDASAPAVSPAIAVAAVSEAHSWSKTHPFPATLQDRIQLNGTGSAKETVHLELSLEGSGLTYLPGDALGVRPMNCPAVIDELIRTVGFSPEEEVNRPDGSAGELRTVLIEELDSTILSKKLIEAYAKVAQNQKLNALLDNSKELREYTNGREIADLFQDYPAKEFTPQQLAELLRVLPPRLYSIASSLRAHPEEVHLTVGTVRYHSHGKQRKGVASTFLAERAAIGDKVPVYVHANNNFRLPQDLSTPIIMVGPGTGVAPFRAFVEERAALNASGKNWLFFGDQHYTYDFLYQLEWQDYLKDEVLSRLDVAFSRDGREKVYVQQRMRENAREIWNWLEAGAHFYVCGDASRMAKDVNQALIDIVAEQGKMKPAEAKKFVNQLTKDKRYQRDVY